MLKKKSGLSFRNILADPFYFHFLRLQVEFLNSYFYQISPIQSGET